MKSVSVSRYLKWKKCPRSYYNKYVLGLEEEETDSLKLGKAIHSMCEHFFDMKPDGSYIITQIKDWAKQIWETYSKDVPEDSLKIAKDMFTNFVKRKLREVEINVEKGKPQRMSWYLCRPKERELEIKGEYKTMVGTSYAFIGYVDYLYRNDWSNDVIIGDYKTSILYNSKPSMDYLSQLCIYARYLSLPISETILEVDYLKYDKQFHFITTKDKVDELFNEFEKFIDFISSVDDKEENYPCSESKLCEHCSFKDICKRL